MIVCCECGKEITIDDQFRLVQTDTDLIQVACVGCVESQDSGEKTSSEVAVPASRSKEA